MANTRAPPSTLSSTAPTGTGPLLVRLSAATFSSFALAARLGALLSFILPDEAMGDWGWRILFLPSVPMGLIAFYIRAKLRESPEFQAMIYDSASLPAPIWAPSSLTPLTPHITAVAGPPSGPTGSG
ncbi:MFS family permease [Arthrobacter sp. ES3-54]|nr:MFS family permease [Arthrobacter sp. ES3-54]